MKTLSQIAKELGVSNAAVSYVYNNKWRENRINEKLAHKIMKKIEEENASPSVLGKQLKTGKTQTIGVILADLERSYNLSILAGIEKKLASTDNLVLLGNSRKGEKEKEFLNAMVNRKVDGLIVCPMFFEADEITKLAESYKNIPLVFIDNYYPEVDIPFVTSDNRWGAYEATKHCIASGQKRVAYFGGYDNNNPVSSERFRGYSEAIQEFGSILEKPFNNPLKNKIENLDSLCLELSKYDTLFSESFIYFDAIIKYITKNNIKISTDIMLVGFDEPSAFTSSISRKPIAFIKQNAELMGEKATELLLKRVDDKKILDRQLFIKPELSWI